MQPMPPLLIIKINITINIMKNMSGKIHQKAGQGITCHRGYDSAGTSSANRDVAKTRLNKLARKQIKVRL